MNVRLILDDFDMILDEWVIISMKSWMSFAWLFIIFVNSWMKKMEKTIMNEIVLMW